MENTVEGFAQFMNDKIQGGLHPTYCIFITHMVTSHAVKNDRKFHVPSEAEKAPFLSGDLMGDSMIHEVSEYIQELQFFSLDVLKEVHPLVKEVYENYLAQMPPFERAMMCQFTSMIAPPSVD